MATALRDHVSCLRVDAATRDELRVLAHGRILLIDYFAEVGPWGVGLGDVELRWLERTEDLPDEAVRLDDVDEVPVFIQPELGPLMAAVRASLEITGPHWLPALRHPSIAIADGGPWVDFFASTAAQLRRRR